jgi:hypothetical protein
MLCFTETIDIKYLIDTLKKIKHNFLEIAIICGMVLCNVVEVC